MTLKEFIYKQCSTIPRFAKKANISYTCARKAYNGGAINLETAYKIVRATNGLVGFLDLLQKELLN